MDDWTSDFWEVYGQKDKLRSPAEIWSMAVSHASEAAKVLRTGEFDLIRRPLAHTFCWLSALIGSIQRDTSDAPPFQAFKDRRRFSSLKEIVWYKYPEHCPACGSRHCECPVLRGRLIEDDGPDAWKEHRDKAWKRMARYRKEPCLKHSLADWQRMFEGIYLGAHDSLRYEDIGFHFLEEVGETSRAIVMLATGEKTSVDPSKLRQDFYTEVADTISWLFSLLTKLRIQVGRFARLSQSDPNGDAHLDLSEILWDEYNGLKEGIDGLRCPTCLQRPCSPTCVPDLEVKTY